MLDSSLSVEKIFHRIFHAERFYHPKNFQYFLQIFAQENVQKLEQDMQAKALLQSASLLPYMSTQSAEHKANTVTSNEEFISSECEVLKHAAENAHGASLAQSHDLQFNYSHQYKDQVPSLDYLEDIKTFMRFALEDDRLKLTMSAPVRRMQQKTQIFPVSIKGSARSRLTHS